MARRRKKMAAPKRRRRRSVGAIGGNAGNIAATVAGIAGGAIAARIIANYAGKMASGTNPKIIAAGQVALGFLFPKLIKGAMGQNIGHGMIAIGGMSLAQSFGIISGIGQMEDEMEVTLSGTDLLSPISGYGEDFGFSDSMSGTDELQVIAGLDDYDY